MNLKTPLTLVLLAAFSTASLLAADTYKIDQKKSKVLFTILNKAPGQASPGPVPGSFKEFSGTFTIDQDNPANSAVNMEIKTASVDTANEKRDDHLRNPDFFKVKEFPTMSFKSTQWKKAAGNSYDVTGDFTLLGKTKPVTVRFEPNGTSGGSAKFQIKRSDFGMSYRVPDTADEVDVTLQIAGTK